MRLAGLNRGAWKLHKLSPRSHVPTSTVVSEFACRNHEASEPTCRALGPVGVGRTRVGFRPADR